MSEKYGNRMFTVEYTVGGWEKGYKEVKRSLLPLSAATEDGRAVEAKAKLARSHAATVMISMIREVIT